MKRIKFFIGDALLALFCCFSLVFPITMCEYSGHRVFAEQEYFTEKITSNMMDDNSLNTDKTMHYDCLNEGSDDYISLISTQYHFQQEETINAVFEVNSECAIIGCDYDLMGCTLVSQTYFNNTISLELQSHFDFSTFRVNLKVYL